MLNTLRNLNESRQKLNIIKEQEEQSPEYNSSKEVKDGVTVINDVDVKLLSTDQMDMELTNEQKTAISSIIDSFKQQVTNLVDFEPGMTINQNQVRLDGTIPDIDIKFTYISGQESGVYINAEMLKLENDVTNMIVKIAKFGESYMDAMNDIITQRQHN